MEIDTESLFWTASDEVMSRVDNMKLEQSKLMLLYWLKDFKIRCMSDEIDKAKLSLKHFHEAHSEFCQDWHNVNEGIATKLPDGLMLYYEEELEHLKTLLENMANEEAELSILELPESARNSPTLETPLEAESYHVLREKEVGKEEIANPSKSEEN